MKVIQSHYRVVAALVIREMSTRFGSKPGGYAWAVLDPIAHIAFMSFIFMGIARHPPLGNSFVLFFATGYLGFQFYQSAAGYVTSAVTSNRALLAYPNVAPIDTVVARLILQFGTNIVVSIAVLLPIIATLKHPVEITWVPLIEGTTAASLLALGIAFTNVVLFQKSPLYEQLFSIISRPLFMLSGVFYLPDSLPTQLRDIILINPVAHMIISFRKGFYPEYRAAGYDPFYMYIFAFSALAFGMCLFTSSKRVLRSR
ncbi:ABC transporter permease [Rhizobium sp. Leaf371]|uniref:ABC transporter permease n=1 Tax=Rhizobium sp. Leaf371 TaxID=1736355 RepID=UPI0012E91711|nr:ABC transporter permease [Rhizobium sp. Leaf371]